MRRLLHLCKRSAVRTALADALGGERGWPRGLAMSEAWDDGTGSTLDGIDGAFTGAERVYVVADATLQGVWSLAMIVRRYETRKRKVELLGVSQAWFEAVERTGMGLAAWEAQGSIKMRKAEVDKIKRVLRAEPGICERFGELAVEAMLRGRSYHMEAFFSNELVAAEVKRGVSEAVGRRVRDRAFGTGRVGITRHG